MYSTQSDISRPDPVPAHLFGTRQAIFLLMRAEPGPEEARHRRPPPRPVPRAQPRPAPRTVLEMLCLEDRFDF